ncbi:hypothetical protein QW131_07905 [Roseibium salinum]|nr:hypothetical protein [Roseibium salinum]
MADPLLSEFYEAVMSARPEEVQQKLKPFLPHLSLCSDKMSSDAPPADLLCRRQVRSEGTLRRRLGDPYRHRSRASDSRPAA